MTDTRRRAEEKRRNRGSVPRINPHRRKKDRLIVIEQGGIAMAPPQPQLPGAMIGQGWKPDVDGSGAVGTSDMLHVIAHWGQPDGFGGTYAVQHVLAIITAWEVDTAPGGANMAPLVDQPQMSVINRTIDCEGNCITRNNGGHCTINLDHAVLHSRSGYCVYADTSDLTRIHASNLTADGYYVLRGTHTVIEATASNFKAANHSFRPYAWRGGFVRDCNFDVEYIRIGGGAANEWENPIDTGGTPDDPIEWTGGRISATAQVTFYNKTHDFIFTDVDFGGTRKLFIDLGAKGLKFIRPRNLPTVDTKGQSTAQLAARGISIVGN